MSKKKPPTLDLSWAQHVVHIDELRSPDPYDPKNAVSSKEAAKLLKETLEGVGEQTLTRAAASNRYNEIDVSPVARGDMQKTDFKIEALGDSDSKD